MKVCTCFLLFGIFANTQSFAYEPKINPKAVNLVLTTELKFHNKDKQSDIKLLDDVQNVIDEIRTVIDKNSNVKKFRRNSRDEALTDFIQAAVNIINTYDDTAFEDFVHILDAEIRQYNYRGCKFSELTENHEIEKLITAKLDSIKSRSTYAKRKKINALSDVLKYENYDSDVKEIVDYINSLYTPFDDKFQRFLSNLEGYGKSKSKSNTNLVEIIKNGLRSIIFDQYTNLSKKTRRRLRHRIENFWRRYKKDQPSKEDNVAKVTPYNTKNSKNIINEAKNLKPDSRKYKKITNNKINQEWIKTKQSKHKNKITKKNDLKNKKKRYRNTRKETIDDSFEIQEKETRQSSQNTDVVVQQSDEIKLQGQTGDSLSASFNSIELHKDQQDTTQQFLAIVPDKYTQKSTNGTKKQNIIDTLSVTTKSPTRNTTQKNLLWIEQSTGRLPKAVLDKLANKTSRSTPGLTGKNLNKYGHKLKKNKDQKWRHRKVNETDKTRRKGYELENAKTHEKMYDLQNHKTLRYSELIRDKTNKKIDQKENEKTHGKIYEQADDEPFGNINEPENNKTPGSLYVSEKDKMNEKKYELENYGAEGKIYDRRHESDRPTKLRFEFDSNYELKEDTKYKHKKNLSPNEPANIKRYETKHGKIQGKVFKPEYNKTHGDIYEPEQDKMHGNILYDKHETMSTIKNQFMYESKEDKKHKTYNTSKPRKPLIVKHNYRDLFSQHDVSSTNSLFNNNDEQQYTKTMGMLRVDLKHYNRPIRSTTEGFLQMLDVQMPTEPDETIKHLARKAPAFSRTPRLQLDDIARMKSTHQTSPQSNSSIGWLDVLPLKANSKSNNKWSRKHIRYSRNSTEYSTSFKEGITAGNIEITDDNRHNAQTTSFSYLKDSVVNKTESSIEDHKDKYVENNRENGKKSETGFKSGFEIGNHVINGEPIDNMIRLNVTGAANNETDFIIEHVVDEDSKNNENRIEKAEKFKINFRSNANNNFNVTQNKLNMAGAEVNIIEKLIEKYIKGNDSTNNYIENILNKGMTSEIRFRSDLNMTHRDFKDSTEKTELTETADNLTEYKDSIINKENGKKSKTNLTSDINIMPNDFKDKTDQTNTSTADIKTDFIEKRKDFKMKEDIVDKDHQIYQVDDQTSIIREAPGEKDQIEQDNKQQFIDDITFEVKNRGRKDWNGETLTKNNEIQVIMKNQKNQGFLNNYNGYDTSKGTQAPTTNIASTSSSVKGTESTTKGSATTVVLTANITPKLTVPVPIPVLKFFEASDVWQTANYNEIFNENKMTETLPDVDVLGEGKSKVNTNATNL